MTDYSGAATQHRTLAVNTEDTVTLDHDYDVVEVLHRGTTGEIYFTVDRLVDTSGNTVTPPDPTIGGAGTYVVLPGSALKVSVPGSSSNSKIRLISSVAAPYSVTSVL